MYRTPLSEQSTAKLQALAWRPSGSGHRTCQRADNLGIAMPSTAERLWPALKFQDFLQLFRGSGHYFTTSPREKPEKSSTISRGSCALLTPKMRKVVNVGTCKNKTLLSAIWEEGLFIPAYSGGFYQPSYAVSLPLKVSHNR